jgi:NADH pyrophosphatase NudC (nudix superfamily)
LSGRIEPGESQEEAVVREVNEEIGLHVRPVAKIWECHTDDGEFLLHWWTANVVEGELKLEPREASAARWVSTGDFLELEPTFAGDREFFRRVLPSLS